MRTSAMGRIKRLGHRALSVLPVYRKVSKIDLEQARRREVDAMRNEALLGRLSKVEATTLDRLSKIEAKLDRLPDRFVLTERRLIGRVRHAEHRIVRDHLYAHYSALFEASRQPPSLSPVPGRERELIVTMTTIPYRIGKIHVVIESLLRQTILPDKIVLNLSRDHFSDDALPPALEHLRTRGVDVRFVDDLGPYKKLIPTMMSDPDALWVTADDDLLYPPEWLERLYRAHLAEPEYVHCHRPHVMTCDDGGRLERYEKWHIDCEDVERFGAPSARVFPTNGAGMISAREHFDPEVLDASVFQTICPIADDVWLKSMTLRRGTLSKMLPQRMLFDKGNLQQNMSIIGDTQGRALFHANQRENANDVQLRAVFDRYDLWGALGCAPPADAPSQGAPDEVRTPEEHVTE